MIIVCEPQCKGISHEKVNSGFIYGLRLAYPKEKILFFANKTHFKVIKNIFKTNKVSVSNLENFPISFNADKSYSLGGIIRYYFLFKKVFDKTSALGTNKVFFLSTNPVILYLIKKLKQQRKYKNICCTFVLHGELEDIANIDYKEPYVPGIKSGTITADYKKAFIKGLRNPGLVFSFAFNYMSGPIRWLDSNYSLIFKKIFRVKKMMMWQHSDQYKYISLSPRVTTNASKYLDTNYLNFNTIIMPIIFAKPLAKIENDYVKFAVFGYGDSAQMYRMLTLLSKAKTTKRYEIRVISMDHRGTKGFSNVTLVGDGKVLSRKEMEESAQDIDMFINLYDKTRHRFGCSLSIFESLSYLKPVLHLSNPGYDYFNNPKKPIGYRTESLKAFVSRMADIIENYQSYKTRLKEFGSNMIDYRQTYSIENNLGKLKTSFTFD